MEPFRITCETCRARLKIRTPDVIGEIHACPKCGGMVQILPPAGWDISSSAPASGQANSVGAPADSLSTTASVFIPAGALDDMAAMAAALESPPPEVPAETPLEIPPTAPVAAGAGTSVLLWTAGGIIAALIVGGLAWAIWPRGNEKASPPAPPVATANDQQAPAKDSAESQPAAPSDEAPKSKAGDAELASKIAATEQAPTAAAKPSADPAALTPDPPANKPKEPAPSEPAPAVAKKDDAGRSELSKLSAAVATPAPPAPVAAPKATETLAAAPDHSPVLKFDPLDFDPDRLGSSIKAPSNAQGSTSSIPDKPPAEVAATGVPKNGTSPAAPADQGKQSGARNAVQPQVANNAVGARRGPPVDPPAHSAAQLLATHIKAFQVADMPLTRFVETMSSVTGTGITLDPIALEQVGIATTATVSVNAQDTPLQAILHDALSQRRLDIADQGGQLRVVLPKADEPHAIDYDVKDLAAGKDAATIGQLVEHFVAPTTWKSAGGKGTLQVNGTTLHIEQSDAVRRQVVIFCERLRLARSLAVQGKYPVAMLSTESPYTRLSAKLSEPTTFTFLPWTRLDDVTRNLQELSGIRVLVDWGTLAEVDLMPSSPVACSALNRSWQESLDGSLEPLGLAWWAVDGDTIQITSLSALEKIERIEFYQVPPKLQASFANSQALVDTLQKELREAGSKQGRPQAAHIEADGPSGKLIVLATPSAHRQLSHRLNGATKP